MRLQRRHALARRVDAALTTVVGDIVKVLAWYDNEMGYSQRLFDLAKFVAEKLCMALPERHQAASRSCRSRASACSCASTSTCRSTRRRGAITDDARIRATLPTLQHLIERGARIVLGSAPRPPRRPGQARALARAGRGAARRAARPRTSRSPTSRVGDGARKVVSDLRDGQIAMLENLRFEPGRGGERRDVRAHARVVLRRLRQRRVRHRAPRARVDRGHGEVRRREGRRLRHGEGDRLPVAPARRRRSPVRRRARRRQGLRQDRGARCAARARRRAS